jgi:hypothetical protein
VLYPAVYPFSLATKDGADANADGHRGSMRSSISARVMPRLYALLFLRNLANSRTSGIEKRVDELDIAIADPSARKAATDIKRSTNQKQADAVMSIAAKAQSLIAPESIRLWVLMAICSV